MFFWFLLCFYWKFPPSTVRLKRECCTLPRLIQWVVSPKNYCDLFVWRRLHKTKCGPGAYSRCFFQIPAYPTSKPWCTVTSWSTLWKKPGRFYLNDFGLHYASETVSPKTPGIEPHSKKTPCVSHHDFKAPCFVVQSGQAPQVRRISGSESAPLQDPEDSIGGADGVDVHKNNWFFHL